MEKYRIISDVGGIYQGQYWDGNDWHYAIGCVSNDQDTCEQSLRQYADKRKNGPTIVKELEL